MSLPNYLNKVEENPHHYFGDLIYEKKSDSWIILGEPVVCQYAKRIFPGSSGRKSGEARFKRNKRTNADLNWLMQRFPLRIADESFWLSDYNEAVDHVLNRIEIDKQPKKLIPSDSFNGELIEFQKESLAFIEQNNPTLVALEMGLGKTVISLSWISLLKAHSGIIVVPKNIINQWKDSIKSFLNLNETDIHVINGLTPYDLPEAKFYIIHYGLLRGWKTELPLYKFDFLVYDEIQELRHRGTEKYSAASLLSESVERRIGMSGTPIYNTGGEIWNVLNILEYHCLGDWDSFTREWCYGYGSDIVSDPTLLGDHLKREGLMIRMTKEEVLEELPDKRRVIFEVDGDEKVFNREIKNALTLISEFDSTEDNLKKGRLKRLIDTETRKATGLAKAKDVCDFVKLLLESGEQVVLYGWHHEVYELWKGYLKNFNPVFITGRESGDQKQRSKDLFTEGKVPLIIISLRAAAGLDGLQNSSSVSVFGELDWSPGVHAQCEDRLHRIGQKDSVLSYYPIASQGQDIDMMEHLGFKTAQFVGIMGDRVENEDDKILAVEAAGKHMGRVIDKLRKSIK